MVSNEHLPPASCTVLPISRHIILNLHSHALSHNSDTDTRDYRDTYSTMQWAKIAHQQTWSRFILFSDSQAAESSDTDVCHLKSRTCNKRQTSFYTTPYVSPPVDDCQVSVDNLHGAWVYLVSIINRVTRRSIQLLCSTVAEPLLIVELFCCCLRTMGEHQACHPESLQ